MQDDSPKPALAEVRSVPTQPYLVIEFPGYVKNQTKVFETFGGVPAILEAHAEKQSQIPCNFRPNDPWSHPVFLDRCLTSNFVLEVTRTTDKKTGLVETKGELVGTVPHTYAFRGLADYQYLPPVLQEIPIEPRLDSTPLREDLEATQHWPPPIFSKTDHPHPYNFEPNSLFKLVTIQDAEGIAERQFVSKKSKQFSEEHLPIIQLEHGGPVPSQPPADHDGVANGEWVTILRTLFDEHPVWSRQAIESYMQNYSLSQLTPYVLAVPEDQKVSQKLCLLSLYQVAYAFSNGPWRHSWIRLGYDPRLEPSSRKYQVIDYRVTEDKTRGKLPIGWAKAPTDKPRRQGTAKIPETSSRRYTEDQRRFFQTQKANEYKFLKPPSQRQTIYSFHEIELPGMEELLARPPSDSVSKDIGWLTSDTFKKIKELMNAALPKLIKDWDEGGLSERIQAEAQGMDLEEDLEEGVLDTDETSIQPNFLGAIALSAVTGKRNEHLEHMASQITSGEVDGDDMYEVFDD